MMGFDLLLGLEVEVFRVSKNRMIREFIIGVVFYVVLLS